MDGPTPRVMLNDRALRNPRTGVGHYITELVRGLARQPDPIQVFGFYSHWRRKARPTAPRASAPAPRARQPWWLRRLAQDVYNCGFEIAGALGQFGLYHEPNHIPMPWQGPIVTTVHDLSVLRHPEWHPADRVDWYHRDFAASLPRSEHFITVSDFTRREMVDLLGIPDSRITTISNGIRDGVHPQRPAQVNAWLAAKGLPREYLLYVGTLEPRKNLARTIAAYALLPKPCRERSPLLITGMPGWGNQDVEEIAKGHGVLGQVRLTGYVSDDHLAMLYCGASALVWPSLYEGFGLPPLEAMASGTPVVTSNCSSLPEVVGDAALLVDPTDVGQICEAVRSVLEDASLADRLRERGLARASQFTWDASAAAHAAVYRRFATT